MWNLQNAFKFVAVAFDNKLFQLCIYKLLCRLHVLCLGFCAVPVWFMCVCFTPFIIFILSSIFFYSYAHLLYLFIFFLLKHYVAVHSILLLRSNNVGSTIQACWRPPMWYQSVHYTHCNYRKFHKRFTL